MKILRPHHQPLAWLLLIVFLSFQASCIYYQRYQMSKARLPKIDTQNLSLYILDASRPASRAWYVSDFKLGQQSMSGFLAKISETEALDVNTVRNNNDARQSRNQVLLYMKPQHATALGDTATLTIPYDQLEKIEVYEVNHGKTVAVNLLVPILTMAAIGLLALLLKSSCPFVYAENPGGTKFQGELYSGSVYPQLERHDWLPMPDLELNGGEYHVRLANRAKEIQHTNLLELVAIDHPIGTEVLFDKNGQLHSLANPQEPTQAIDFEGKDALEAIRCTDETSWQGNPESQRSRADAGVILTFKKPADARSAKLVVNAKNTFWMDFMYGLFLDEFGDYAGQVREKYAQKSDEEIRQWMHEQNIPLSVSVETAPGQWQKVDFFHLSGPMALKKDVVSLDLSAVPGEQVRIKLESGFLFWEIDYAALDFSENEEVVVQTMKPASAISQTGEDMSAALASDDALYYSQPNVGDEATVKYPMPAQTKGTKRSLLLHAKGHYQILRDPVPGKPSLLYLRQFLKPDALPVYSRERWRELENADSLTDS